jgi:acrylyl-CoA reductase (NADPH)
MTPLKFRGLRVHQTPDGIVSRFDELTLDDLQPGNVVIRVLYSCINYKDALAVTGKGKILRRYPLVAGIDLSGEVLSSEDGRFRPGQKVLVVGSQLSETQDGGYAQYARVPADSVVPIPSGLNEVSAMVLGTAGFTAALAVMRMTLNGQDPAQGEILVTGASGGVGACAIDILASQGFKVVAFTGKPELQSFFSSLGASRIVDRNQLKLGTRPLETPEWAGAVDNAGGETLAWLTRTVQPGGNIASIGLASSADLKTTVMPFILRGINLLGINSVLIDNRTRHEAWRRLGSDLKPKHLNLIHTRTVEFNDLLQVFPEYLRSEVRGRTVVKIA